MKLGFGGKSSPKNQVVTHLKFLYPNQGDRS